MNASRDKSDSLTSSSLRRLIRGARGHERLPKIQVTADSVFEGYQLRRGRRRDRTGERGVGVAGCLSASRSIASSTAAAATAWT